jgi:DNA-binding SARP family transcriptional activator/tetratricopeptide (TPR) repeat protein
LWLSVWRLAGAALARILASCQDVPVAPGDRLLFGLLGPLLVRQADVELRVTAARQRVLLATLLVRHGHVVSADELVEHVWDGLSPGGARATLHSYVMRLRHQLGPVAGARIVTCQPGYAIRLDTDELDETRFRTLIRAGTEAVREQSWSRASLLLAEALQLWRGVPLADVPSEELRRLMLPQWEQLRLQAIEAKNEADLCLGKHAQLVPELYSLTAEHPLRERLHGQLMLAMYRSGCQADALAAYQRARRLLVDQLGVEPTVELRELHQRILAADVQLSLPTASLPTPSVPARTVSKAAPAEPDESPSREIAKVGADGHAPAAPCLLPPAPASFVGRDNELAALSKMADMPGSVPGVVPIAAIVGAAGVGKTALAVHWAHQAADRFPNGQLYVDLRGFDPGRPMAATDALAGFLRALGVAGQDIPAEQDERAARFRSLLAGRRLLVVLDNAADVAQVRPLLPGTAGCVAVVTSRDSLPGLVARDGARRLDLDVLPLAEAVGLLRLLIGERVDEDPPAAEALAAECGCLPLALRVAAELATARPGAQLPDLVDELADPRQRLDLLEAGDDPRTAVRAVFSWSYKNLDPATATAFRLAGLHPGANFDGYALAALADTTLPQASRLVDRLVRAHLVQSAGHGRYGMHDLLRAHALELSLASDSDEARRAALTRLLDFYLSAASAAMDTLFPAERHRRPSVCAPTTPVPSLADAAAARAWLDGELANFVAVTAHAEERGWPGHATRLATILFRYLDVGGRLAEASTIHAHARKAASRLADSTAEATALTSLGTLAWRRCRYTEAIGHLREALALQRAAADQAGQARTLGNLGLVVFQQGGYQQAARYYRQALALFRRTGDRPGSISSLGNLGTIEMRQGRYQQAARHHRQALDLCYETGIQMWQAYALLSLGVIEQRIGRHEQAAAQLLDALNVARDVSDFSAEAYVLTSLGVVLLRQGRHAEAVRSHERALTLFRDIGDRSGEAEALNGLGEALLGSGRPERALAQHAAALSLATQTGEKYQQACAHDGLAKTYQASADNDHAAQHWRAALALYVELGAPEADEARAALTAVPNSIS